MENIVYISGATGLIGNAIAAKLKENNTGIGVLTRNASKAKREIPFADDITETDYVDKDISEKLGNAKAVINLAGANLNGKRWDEKYKKLIYGSRIDTTRYLAGQINSADNKPEVFISVSGANYYGDSGEMELTEDAPAGDDFLANVCKDWESEVHKLKDCRKIIARLGVVLDKHEGAFPKMYQPVKYYIGGKLGSGKQWFPWIHIDDIAELFLRGIINKKMEGVYNFSSPDPQRNESFIKKLASQAGKPAVFPVPEFALKFVLGEASGLVLASLKLVPEKLTKEDYRFKYPDTETVLKKLIS